VTRLAAVGGAAYVLLKEDVLAGRWNDSFVLVPATLLIAVAMGHLSVAALRNWKPIPVVAFAIAFLVATGMTVWMSVGKQVATTQSTILASEASNSARADREAELKRARQRYEKAQQQADRERGSTCGRKCQDWELRAREVEAHISKLETELKKMEPPKPSVTAGEDRIAQITALLSGYEQERAKATLMLTKPFLFSLLFEWSSIWAFGYAFGHGRRLKVPSETVPAPSKKPRGTSRNRRNLMIDAWVAEFRKRHGRAPTIREVQEWFPGTPKTTAWRYAGEAA
jgi:hypothetical protein